jgi:hypothetical protein
MYESWYLRLVSPDEPLGIWIRYTVFKRPGFDPVGTVWFTLFDGAADRPVAIREQRPGPFVPPGEWIRIGSSAAGPSGIQGHCGEATWSLTAEPSADALFHLPDERLYRLPLPKTKPISPMPEGRFTGRVEVAGRVIEVDGWRGMTGHNWGREHAERWIWMAGTGFIEDPEAWIDVVLGRIRVAGHLLPWVANGAYSLGGAAPVRVGGMLARDVTVEESAHHLSLTLPSTGGGAIEVEVDSPPNATVGWRYADPTADGEPPREHDVANCSIARLALTVHEPHSPSSHQLLSDHGGAYELGMKETDHGVPIEPGTEGSSPANLGPS